MENQWRSYNKRVKLSDACIATHFLHVCLLLCASFIPSARHWLFPFLLELDWTPIFCNKNNWWWKKGFGARISFFFFNVMYVWQGIKKANEREDLITAAHFHLLRETPANRNCRWSKFSRYGFHFGKKLQWKCRYSHISLNICVAIVAFPLFLRPFLAATAAANAGSHDIGPFVCWNDVYERNLQLTLMQL